MNELLIEATRNQLPWLTDNIPWLLSMVLKSEYYTVEEPSDVCLNLLATTFE